MRGKQGKREGQFDSNYRINDGVCPHDKWQAIVGVDKCNLIFFTIVTPFPLLFTEDLCSLILPITSPSLYS